MIIIDWNSRTSILSFLSIAWIPYVCNVCQVHRHISTFFYTSNSLSLSTQNIRENIDAFFNDKNKPTIISRRCSHASRLWRWLKLTIRTVLFLCAFSFIQCKSSLLRSRATNPMFTGGRRRRRRRRRSSRRRVVSAQMHNRHNTIIIRCPVRHREEVHESSLSSFLSFVVFFLFLFRKIIECAM